MAHNLEIINGEGSFASTQKAWHGLGTIVDNPMTAEEAIELAKLGYTVEKEKIYINVQGLQIEVPRKFATYRTDTNVPLGVIGNGYTIVQNKDAFTFFDSIVETGEAIYETAGVLGQGEKIFITAKLPDYIRVPNTNDITEVYVLLTSAHDGSGSIVGGITPVRVVCNNTLNMALTGLRNKVAFRHTTNVQEKMMQAGKLMGITNEYKEAMQDMVNLYAKAKVDDSIVKQIISEVFVGKDESTRTKNILDDVWEAYQIGTGQEKIVGTKWGVLNGVSYYLGTKNYKTPDRRFSSIIDGDSSIKLQKAYNLVAAL